MKEERKFNVVPDLTEGLIGTGVKLPEPPMTVARVGNVEPCRIGVAFSPDFTTRYTRLHFLVDNPAAAI